MDTEGYHEDTWTPAQVEDGLAPSFAQWVPEQGVYRVPRTLDPLSGAPLLPAHIRRLQQQVERTRRDLEHVARGPVVIREQAERAWRAARVALQDAYGALALDRSGAITLPLPPGLMVLRSGTTDQHGEGCGDRTEITTTTAHAMIAVGDLVLWMRYDAQTQAWALWADRLEAGGRVRETLVRAQNDHERGFSVTIDDREVF